MSFVKCTMVGIALIAVGCGGAADQQPAIGQRTLALACASPQVLGWNGSTMEIVQESTGFITGTVSLTTGYETGCTLNLEFWVLNASGNPVFRFAYPYPVTVTSLTPTAPANLHVPSAYWGQPIYIGVRLYQTSGYIYRHNTTITIRRPPSVDSITFDEGISELTTSAIDVSASDPAGGTLSYTWEVLNGSAISGSGSSVTFDPPDAGPHPCPYEVQVTATSSVSGLSTVANLDITVKLGGDVDGNGVVNIIDKVAVRNAFGSSGAPGWIPEDVNFDGVVNIVDKVIVRNQFGQSGCALP